MEVRAKHIAHIVSDYEAMCREVLEQMNRVYGMLRVEDLTEVVRLVQHQERIIDGMEVKLHNDVMRAIVLYTPRATDSRLIISYYDMAGNLERIGDLLLNLSDYILQIDREGAVYSRMVDLVDKQFHQVKRMLETSIFAFSCGDVPTAREVLTVDDAIDRMHDEISSLIPEILMEEESTLSEVQTALRLYGLSYCLERIGDHASNIAEATIYTYEGVLAKHSPLNFSDDE